MIQGRSVGFDHCGNLLFHAGSRRGVRLDWIGRAYAVFGLRFVPLTRDLFDLGALRLVKKKESAQMISSQWLPWKY